jgi:hypothetical protein
MNLKKVYRLYREERLKVRKRGGRKRWGCVRRLRSRRNLTSAGRSTSCRMHWPASGGSVCLTSSTIKAGDGWRASSIPCCQAGVSCAS